MRITAIAAGGYHTVAVVIPDTPTIVTQPTSQTVNEWQSASFAIVASGVYLSYQWRKDGVNLPGATNATYSLPFAQTNQAGSYTVALKNDGSVLAWGLNDYGQTTVPVAAHGKFLWRDK